MVKLSRSGITKSAITKIQALLIIALIVVAGVGGTLAWWYVKPKASSVVSGRVYLHKPVVDSTISIYNLKGDRIFEKEYATNGAGSFQIVVAWGAYQWTSILDKFKIVATGGTLENEPFTGTVTRMVEDYKEDMENLPYYELNAVTTLIAACMDANPELSHAEAGEDVERFLEVPSGYSVSDIIDHGNFYYAVFDHFDLMLQASQAGGFDAFIDQLVDEIESGVTHPIRLVAGVPSSGFNLLFRTVGNGLLEGASKWGGEEAMGYVMRLLGYKDTDAKIDELSEKLDMVLEQMYEIERELDQIKEMFEEIKDVIIEMEKKLEEFISENKIQDPIIKINETYNALNRLAKLKPPEIIIFDGGGAKFWTLDGWGDGSYALSGSDDRAEKKVSDDSYKVELVSGDYRDPVFYHDYSTTQDWSKKEILDCWWYGANSGRNVNVYIHGPTENDYWGWRFADDFTGWKRIVLNLKDPDTGYEVVKPDYGPFGSPSLSTVSRVLFQIEKPESGEGPWHLDRTTVDIDVTSFASQDYLKQLASNDILSTTTGVIYSMANMHCILMGAQACRTGYFAPGLLELFAKELADFPPYTYPEDSLDEAYEEFKHRYEVLLNFFKRMLAVQLQGLNLIVEASLYYKMTKNAQDYIKDTFQSRIRAQAEKFIECVEYLVFNAHPHPWAEFSNMPSNPSSWPWPDCESAKPYLSKIFPQADYFADQITNGTGAFTVRVVFSTMQGKLFRTQDKPKFYVIAYDARAARIPKPEELTLKFKKEGGETYTLTGTLKEVTIEKNAPSYWSLPWVVNDTGRYVDSIGYPEAGYIFKENKDYTDPKNPKVKFLYYKANLPEGRYTLVEPTYRTDWVNKGSGWVYDDDHWQAFAADIRHTTGFAQWKGNNINILRYEFQPCYAWKTNFKRCFFVGWNPSTGPAFSIPWSFRLNHGWEASTNLDNKYGYFIEVRKDFFVNGNPYGYWGGYWRQEV